MAPVAERRGVAQSGSASALGAEGRWFKSGRPDHRPAKLLRLRKMPARIYKPAKSATQSGLARTKQWLLVFEQDSPREIEPLMGWTSSGDMRQQLRLWFDTKEEAIAYAERQGIAYRVEEPHEMKRRSMSYSDNFKFNRVEPWTH
jgi:hypothetical protein